MLDSNHKAFDSNHVFSNLNQPTSFSKISYIFHSTSICSFDSNHIFIDSNLTTPFQPFCVLYLKHIYTIFFTVLHKTSIILLRFFNVIFCENQFPLFWVFKVLLGISHIFNFNWVQILIMRALRLIEWGAYLKLTILRDLVEFSGC